MARNELIKTTRELNDAVMDFHNRLFVMRLVNAGASHSAVIREEFLGQALDAAFDILSSLSAKGNACSSELFKRIYSETRDLVKGPYVTQKMEKMHSCFYTKTLPLVQNIAQISLDKSISR